MVGPPPEGRWGAISNPLAPFTSPSRIPPVYALEANYFVAFGPRPVPAAGLRDQYLIGMHRVFPAQDSCLHRRPTLLGEEEKSDTVICAPLFVVHFGSWLQDAVFSSRALTYRSCTQIDS